MSLSDGEHGVYIQDPDFTLWHGDVREVLPTLPAESVDCALTSPPFYALRDYGTGQWEGGDEGCDHMESKPSRTAASVAASGLEGGKDVVHRSHTYGAECGRCGARRVDKQIGLEATPDEWVAELVAVFRELRRVLKPQATLWLEVGDMYASSGTRGDTRSGFNERYFGSGNPGKQAETSATLPPNTVPHGLKAKDLIGAPWLLAFALRADGWYLRQCIVWEKPSAMPESVRDRCTTSHSYIFLFAKNPRYYFDADAIAEPAAWDRWGDQTVPKYNGTDTASGWMEPKSRELLARPTKNARSVWRINTQGFDGAHFATFPEALVERIVKAGCPEWVCAVCGKARERIVERTGVRDVLAEHGRSVLAESPNRFHSYSPPNSHDGAATPRVVTVGWSDCGHNNYQPGVILDPFGGSGTSALVARRLGRRSVLVELNESYCAMAARRLQQLSLLADGSAA